MRPGVLLLGAALLSTTGCSSPAREAEGAIRRYDLALVEAFRSGDASPLSAVAGEKEATKVGRLVELKKQARLVLESSLDALEVSSAGLEADGALHARTVERWTYQDRPLDPGSAPLPRFVSRMTLDYVLTRDAPREPWKVDQVRTVESTFLEPAGYQLPRPPR